MKTSVIRPGILVALKSTVSGGVQYRRVDLETRELENGESTLTRWETTRVIDDPAEHERAVKARGKALSEIRSVCSPTSFGLLCPADREGELDEAIARARTVADTHNSDPESRTTRVYIYALKGRIASTDEEAARAIGQEVSALLSVMSSGIERMDPAAIREACTKASQMGALLGDEQVSRVSEAVEEARRAARAIVKRVEKGGEEAARVLQDLQRGKIEKARIAFLDFDAPAEPAGPEMPQVNAQRFADLDTAPESEPSPAPSAPASGPDLDMNPPPSVRAASPFPSPALEV